MSDSRRLSIDSVVSRMTTLTPATRKRLRRPSMAQAVTTSFGACPRSSPPSIRASDLTAFALTVLKRSIMPM